MGNILKRHGIEPAPDRKRKTTWKTFIKSHWDVLASVDFTTVEVWTSRGLVTFYLLFVMEVATRRVHFAGCTVNPHENWMKEVARNLTDPCEGFLLDKRYLIMDRDTKFRNVLGLSMKARQREHIDFIDMMMQIGISISRAWRLPCRKGSRTQDRADIPTSGVCFLRPLAELQLSVFWLVVSRMPRFPDALHCPSAEVVFGCCTGFPPSFRIIRVVLLFRLLLLFRYQPNVH